MDGSGDGYGFYTGTGGGLYPTDLIEDSV
jgi:hypothetical protein